MLSWCYGNVSFWISTGMVVWTFICPRHSLTPRTHRLDLLTNERSLIPAFRRFASSIHPRTNVCWRVIFQRISMCLHFCPINLFWSPMNVRRFFFSCINCDFSKSQLYCFGTPVRLLRWVVHHSMVACSSGMTLDAGDSAFKMSTNVLSSDSEWELSSPSSDTIDRPPAPSGPDTYFHTSFIVRDQSQIVGDEHDDIPLCRLWEGPMDWLGCCST